MEDHISSSAMEGIAALLGAVNDYHFNTEKKALLAVRDISTVLGAAQKRCVNESQTSSQNQHSLTELVASLLQLPGGAAAAHRHFADDWGTWKRLDGH